MLEHVFPGVVEVAHAGSPSRHCRTIAPGKITVQCVTAGPDRQPARMAERNLPDRQGAERDMHWALDSVQSQAGGSVRLKRSPAVRWPVPRARSLVRVAVTS